MSFNPQQRRLLRRAGIVLLALLILGGSYTYLLPRTALQVETAYHFSFSGHFIQSRLTNDGTRELTEVELHLAVWSETGFVTARTYAPGPLAPREAVKLEPLHYYGDTGTYRLVLTLRFNDDGESREMQWSHVIADYQNLVWRDRYAHLG